MTTDVATIEAQIAEAEAALHKLLLGQKVVKVEYDGSMTEYQRSSIPELRRYIAALKRKLPNASVNISSKRVTF